MIIKLIRYSLVLLCLCSTLYAAGEPLNVGIESFTPPFVIQGSDNNIYGFDVEMMSSLCKMMQRTCQFRVMRFDELLPAVASKKIDVAVSSITITAERSQTVNFSIPYLLSYSRFLTTRVQGANQTFSLDLLNNKKIGVAAGTVFANEIQMMGVKNASIQSYPTTEAALEALNNGEVDFILVDNPTATYWAANSANAFVTIGEPYMYGYGFGIAVNKTETNLLQTINKLLVQYQGSDEYKMNYTRYLQQF